MTEEEFKQQSQWFLQTAKEQGWLTPEIEKEEQEELASLLADLKKKETAAKSD